MNRRLAWKGSLAVKFVKGADQVLENAVPCLLGTIYSLWKKRWILLWSEVPRGKCLRLSNEGLRVSVVEFDDKSVAEFI